MNYFIGCSGEDDNDDDGDDDFDIDDSDDYTPAKAYQKKQRNQAQQPKRGRGRPRKIRDPDVLEKGKGANWRDRKTNKCPYCIKKFTRRSHVTEHIRKRHGFECNICNTKYVQNSFMHTPIMHFHHFWPLSILLSLFF